MKIVSTIFFVFIISGYVHTTDWQTITSMNEVSDITASSDKIWAATTGGLFSFDIEEETTRQYTNIQGLKSIRLYAVAADDHGQVISGGENGILEILRVSSGEWRQNYELDGFPIEDIFYSRDTLWVAAGKGVAAFFWNGSDYVFYDYFLNFPILPKQVTTVTVFNNRIWLGTDTGLLSAPSDFSGFVLNNPGLWTHYAASDSLRSAHINTLAEYKNALYVGTPGGLSRVDQNGVMHLVRQWKRDEEGTYLPVDRLSATDVYIFMASGRRLYRSIIDINVYLKWNPGDIKGLATDNKGDIWAGLEGYGLYKYGWPAARKIDGPYKNIFRSVLKTSGGTLMAASGKPGGYTRDGFYTKDNAGWRNYFVFGTHWALLHNTVNLYEDRFRNVWIGSWGGGLMVLPENKEAVFFHNYTNLGGSLLETTVDSVAVISLDSSTVYSGFFTGTAEDTTYEIISAVQEDRNGRIWFANYWASNGNFLASAPYTNDGFVNPDKNSWVYFGQKDGLNIDHGSISCLEFDYFGRVWMGTLTEGVYLLDFNNTVTNKNDDRVYHFTMSEDNLYSDRIFSIKSDPDGVVWIGTAAGLNSYDGVNMYKHVGDPDGRSGPLENRINQIFVDDYNNKWFATSAGLSILRAGNSPWQENAWKGYNTENSGLVDNDVNAVFIDAASAEAYVGTNNGLSVYSGTYAEIRDNFKQIAGGPSPFIPDEQAALYTIINLRSNSTVKIFTLNGALIRELRADITFGEGISTVEGSRAYWDGRDRNGNMVSSGIYLYAAYTVDGKSVSGKIAVIRK